MGTGGICESGDEKHLLSVLFRNIMYLVISVCLKYLLLAYLTKPQQNLCIWKCNYISFSRGVTSL